MSSHPSLPSTTKVLLGPDASKKASPHVGEIDRDIGRALLIVAMMFLVLLTAPSIPVALQPGGPAFSAGTRSEFFQPETPATLAAIRPGTTLLIEVDSTTHGRSDLSALLGKPGTANQTSPEIQFRVLGIWELTAVERHVDRLVLAGRLSRGSIRWGPEDGKTSSDETALAQELEHASFAVVDAQGRVTHVYCPPSDSSAARGIRRLIWSDLQLVAPAQAGPSGSLWTVQEQDAFGNCTARYQLQDTTSDSGRAEIRREVVAYRASPTDSIPLTYEPSGAMRYEFRPDGFVDRWAGEVNLAIRVGEGVLAETRHRVSMQRVAVHRRSHSQRESLVGQFAHLSARVAPVGLPPHLSALRRRELLSQAALNDATLESLLHDLMQIEQGLDDGSDSELVNRLASFVQIHPESIGALAKSIADQRASLVRIRILGQALAAVGTADCQAALCRAVRQHEGSADATLELILALGSLKVPTVETIQCLQSIANRIQDRDVGWTAELAVGAAGRRLAGTDRWLSARIAQDFVQRLEATDDDDERVQYLLVLGNLGHADALATILTHVRAESVRVRAAAVWALRFLEHSAARDAILSALQGDVSLEVRRQALEALGQRANEDWAVSALETTAGEKGLDASLHSRALQILGHALSPSDPRLVAAARRCIEEGSDGDLQQVAQRTLVNAAARPAR